VNAGPTYLVTGGAGFIGSHLTDCLVHRGCRVRVVDNLSTGREANISHLRDSVEFFRGDLTDPAVCHKVVDGIDTVFHVAALPSVPRSLADPWACHEHNVNATVHLLQACVTANVQRIVYSSSSSIYGDTQELPKVETTEPLPRSPYAAAKLAGEQYVLAFARAGLIEAVALRYFNVFGPRQDANSAYAAVIPALFECAATGRPARIYGDGNQTRDFTYVSNVVEGNWLAATRGAKAVNGWVVNVGAGARTSVLDLLGSIQQVTGTLIERTHMAPRNGDVRDSLAALDRAHSVLGYEPLVDLADGLRRTWEWFCGRRVPVAT